MEGKRFYISCGRVRKCHGKHVGGEGRVKGVPFGTMKGGEGGGRAAEQTK